MPKSIYERFRGSGTAPVACRSCGDAPGVRYWPVPIRGPIYEDESVSGPAPSKFQACLDQLLANPALYLNTDPPIAPNNLPKPHCWYKVVKGIKCSAATNPKVLLIKVTECCSGKAASHKCLGFVTTSASPSELACLNLLRKFNMSLPFDPKTWGC